MPGRLRWRAIVLSATISMVSLALSSAGAFAQTAGTGTLTGQLTWCKVGQRPLGELDQLDPSLMADVTPGGRHLRPVIARVPAVDVPLGILGTDLSARTDATGRFTLSGLPAAQPLSLVVHTASGPDLMLQLPDGAVGSGQTRDLGTVGLAGCGDPGRTLTAVPNDAAVVGGAATTTTTTTTATTTTSSPSVQPESSDEPED
jgi:hypothetical protein